MSELDPNFQYLARGMLEEKIIRFGKALHRGTPTLAYVNMGDMFSIPNLFADAVGAYSDTLIDSDIYYRDGIPIPKLLGNPETAIPYSSAIAHELGEPFLYHRIRDKKHGVQRQIEGRYQDGDKIIIVESEIVTGGSVLRESLEIEEFGLETIGVVALIDREQGAQAELEAQGIVLVSAMTLSGIAKFALDEGLGKITQTLYDDLLNELGSIELEDDQED